MNIEKRWEKVDKAVDKLNDRMTRLCFCVQDLDKCGKDECGEWDKCMFIAWIRFRNKFVDALSRRTHKRISGKEMEGKVKWCEGGEQEEANEQQAETSERA